MAPKKAKRAIVKDEKYKLKREKNKEAVKVTRAKKRQESEEVKKNLIEYRNKNLVLEGQASEKVNSASSYLSVIKAQIDAGKQFSEEEKKIINTVEKDIADYRLEEELAKASKVKISK